MPTLLSNSSFTHNINKLAMAILEVILIVGLGVSAVMLFTSAFQQRQQQVLVENAFYKLLEEQDSCISLIQLAAAARVDTELAKQYLERQVKLLNALTEVDDDGNTFYRFPKLRHPYSNRN